MKLITALFAVYLLLLAAVPCCRVDDCAEEKTAHQTAPMEKQGDCGTCSPFFSCESCVAATILYEPIHFELTALTLPQVFAAYLQPFLPQPAFDFWQPPKWS